MVIKQQQYFQKLNQTLRAHERAIPFLLLDLDILDYNIKQLQAQISPAVACRIVVKSLPSLPLLQYVMDKLATPKLMVFHQPFLSDISKNADSQTDILLGKPMPVKTAAYYYQHLSVNEKFNPYTQVQWLVDTTQRIEEYLALAKKMGQRLRLNLEIDIGLHRGGFQDVAALGKALQLIENNPQYLDFSGFMGYDPHVAKLPKILISQQKAFEKATAFYTACVDLLQHKFPKLDHENLTFNGAGSPTLEIHKNHPSVLNEVAAGSCLVKPSTFDMPSLEAYQAACFIATPVLKKFQDTTIPAIEGFKKWMRFFNSNFKQSYFIYGGYWKADYHYPKGIHENALFGKSTNQVMLNAPKNTVLEVDDFVFLRPQQSEFVFLQFGNILTVRKEKIVGEWELLKEV